MESRHNVIQRTTPLTRLLESVQPEAVNTLTAALHQGLVEYEAADLNDHWNVTARLWLASGQLSVLKERRNTMKPTVTLLAAVMLLICTQALAVQEKSVTGARNLLLLSDKAASRKLYLTADNVTYISAGRQRWILPRPETSFKYNDASFLPGKVLVSTFSDQKKLIVLSAYTTAGKKLWTFQTPQVCGPPFIEVNGFEQYVQFSSKCFQTQFNTYDHLLEAATGREVASGINTLIVSVLNSRLVVSYGQFIRGGYTPAVMQRSQFGEPLPGQPQRAWFFYDVPRVSCARLRNSRYHWVSGEYIYSENEDRCGRYTLRFHWTDLKRPRPEIIPDWSLSGPTGRPERDVRAQDVTMYLISGKWKEGPLMCPLLSPYSAVLFPTVECPTPEQRTHFGR